MKLLVMFFATTLILVAALGWMGWQLVRQDRALAGQRMRERLESAADLAVAGLQKHISQTEEQLTGLSAAPQKAPAYAAGLPDDSALLILRAGDLEAYPAHRLLFYPVADQGSAPPVFAAIEALEFRQQDYARVIATLRSLAQHGVPAIRAEAQMRLGRNLWKNGQVQEALAAYEELAHFGSVPVAGMPAELVAREARLLALEKQKDQSAARSEAAKLCSALGAGAWHINRASFDFYWREACATPQPSAAVAISAAAGAMWEEWRAIRGGETPPSGRRAFWHGDQPLLLVWRGSADSVAALVLGQRWLKPLLKQDGARIALTGSDGRVVLGSVPNENVPQSVRMASSTQLPWTLHAVSTEDAGATPFAARQRLILTGLLTLLLLVLAGSYFIGRAAVREVAVAKLQSDFVASVSHEFRTPITALRQLSELLVSGRVASDEDRQEYYQALAAESERLHRVVEGLLDFGRLEARKMQFRFEQLDVAEFLGSVVAEFRRGAEAHGYQIELLANGSAPRVLADRAALGCVIWNLLDNAVKYSPECFTVWVELGREGRRAAIRVRDRGIGIPTSEQKQIFHKFVRGAAAKSQSIRGAGVGLAMARRIVAAHEGEITVDSRPGEGSTFSVLLPEVS